VATLLFGFGVTYAMVPLAAEWEVRPQLNVVETYSDNIFLAVENAKAEDDYVTQIVPAITIKGDGNRLQLDSSYSMQNIVYAKNSSRNQTSNQLQLAADAELIEDFFFLSVDGRLSQQLLTPLKGLSSDNINIDSGRSDVVTTRVEPSLKHKLGQYVEFDLSYSEGRANYDGGTVSDTRLQKKRFSIGRDRKPVKFDWQLNYSESEQWAADILKSEQEQSSASLRYAIFDRLSLIANGGREDGHLDSRRNYESGTYWSAGLLWRVSPRLSLEAAGGDNDRQGRIAWAPSSRTSLNAGYVDRDVGVRPRSAVNATFKHSTRRTLWTLDYVEEITTDAALAIVGYVPDIMVDRNGQPLFDDLGMVMIGQEAQLGIVDEFFQRQSRQGSFTYSVRKNDLSLGLSSEQRHYEVTQREAQLHSGYLGWRLRLSPRASSNLKYTLNRTTESNAANESETRILTWSLSRAFGRRISTGLELRGAEADGGTPATHRSENRISANARVIF
jgi:hypothetical protein